MTDFPTFAMPTLAPSTPGSPIVPFRIAPAFDFDAGDFVLDGRGRVTMATAQQAWVDWCRKALLVERYSCLVYSDQYGVEIDRATREAAAATVQSAIAATITQALMRDRRTASVTGFTFSWQGDALTVTFTVIPQTGKPTQLGVTLNV